MDAVCKETVDTGKEKWGCRKSAFIRYLTRRIDIFFIKRRNQYKEPKQHSM